MAWDDAAPTSDDLKLHPPTKRWDDAPPSPQEMGVKPSIGEAMLRGGAQGASLGFSDELEGLGGAVGNALGSRADKIESTNPAVQAKLDAIAGPQKSFTDNYADFRDKARQANEAASAAHPYAYGASQFAGGALPLALAGPAALSAPGLAATGAVMGAGDSEADLTKLGDDPSQALQLAKDAGKTAAITLAGGKAIEKVAPYVTRGIGKAGGYLTDAAEALAEKATGATRAQAEKFVDGTGRELLDRGIVNFGSSPKDIAANAARAIEKSGENIGSVLSELDSKGVTVDRRKIINTIKDRIAALSDDESQNDLVRALKNKVADIEGKIPEAGTRVTGFYPVEKPVTMTPAVHENDAEFFAPGNPKPARYIVGDQTDQWANLRGPVVKPEVAYTPISPKMGELPGESQIPISKSEQIKRGFDKAAKWNGTSTAAETEANKITANAYRSAAEDSATSFDPNISDRFVDDKRAYHVLSPVEDAASKRALQLQQSPHGGLLDIAAGGTGGTIGALIGGPGGGVIGTGLGLGVKALRPRFASVGAVTADKLGSMASSIARALPNGAMENPAIRSAVLSAIESRIGSATASPALAKDDLGRDVAAEIERKWRNGR